MPYDPKALANFFIDAAAAEGKKLTPIQIIKLVYVAHGWHLAFTSQPLINEMPEAWQYGPVIPSLYHALKEYGNGPVKKKLTSFDQDADPFDLSCSEVPSPTDPQLRGFLQSVWERYGRFTGFQLSALTHQSGTPWQKTWDLLGAKYSKGIDIPESDIINHYRELKAKNVKRNASAAA
jgi:uncharacterized phage-associated protein